MSSEEKKKARELQRRAEQEAEIRRQIKRNRIIAAGIVLGIILLVFMLFKYPAYLGYCVAVFAIPYGLYGLVQPYKSARLYAKKGYAVTYSCQLASLILSMGILAIVYSRMYDKIQENFLYLVGLLVYIMVFFYTLNLLQKRYIEKQ